MYRLAMFPLLIHGYGKTCCHSGPIVLASSYVRRLKMFRSNVYVPFQTFISTFQTFELKFSNICVLDLNIYV